jgi:hypothetical protein
VGGAAVLLAPTLLAELRFAQYYDPASKVTYDATISTDFSPFGSYFYDGTYRWLGNNPHHQFVQIDFALWIPIAIALVGVMALWVVSGRRPDQTLAAGGLHVPCILLLLASLCVYMFFQLPISLGLYNFLSPLLAIDYPYRMLTFISPICVILVVAIASYFFRTCPASVIPKVVAVVWLASLIAVSPLTSTWTASYGVLQSPGRFYDVTYSEPPQYLDYQTYKGLYSFSGVLFAEYLPKIYNSRGQELSDDVPLYTQLHDHQNGAASLSTVPCQVVVPTRSALESLQLTFKVSCRGVTRLALPVTFNAYSSVFIKGRGGTLHPIPYFHSATDPRMIIDVHSSKTELIEVHLPTLWGVLR